MAVYLLAAALVVWLGLGLLAICACAVGGRAEAAWRAAQRRAEAGRRNQPKQKQRRSSGLRAAMF